MSSFSNKGLRADKKYLNLKTKRHVEAFYKILGDMDELATKLDPSIEYNEENINDYVIEFYRELDSMEKFVLLGKLHHKGNNADKEFYERKESDFD